jgi:arylsulfatase A-like enzyme
VILYAPCTVNKNLLSPYDASLPFTPNLADFARRAVTFAAHRTEAGSSGVAYAALLAGVQADRHGVFRHPTALSDGLYLIPEAYADAGYETFFWNQHGMASIALNYGQGVRDENAFRRPLEASDARFQEILSRLRGDPDFRAFVMTNPTVTHGPYDARPLRPFLREYPNEARNLPPREVASLAALYRQNHLALAFNLNPTLERLGLTEQLPTLARVIELLYRANIHELDRQFGGILDAVDAHGLREEALVVFTADHGEVLYREGLVFPWTHSSSLAPEVVEIPLLIATPDDAIAPGLYRGVTRSIDVFPTMAALSGSAVNARDGVEGVSLAPAMRTGEIRDHPAYSHTAMLPDVVYRRMRAPGGDETWGWRAKLIPRPDARLMWIAVRQGDRVFKLRSLDGASWKVHAFDVRTDPLETLDVFDPNQTGDAEMAQALIRYKQRLVEAAGAFAASETERMPAGDEQTELLRGLGYIR